MKVFLQLGSNEGNRQQNLILASGFISLHLGNILKKSGIYETEPWNMQKDTVWFLNQVLLIETDLSPVALLSKIKEYEKKHGRKIRKDRNKKYEDRVIDIDILFYGDLIVNTHDLSIPHPLLHMRRFVLLPLNEIAPDFIHPIFNKTISELLSECNDETVVKEFEMSVDEISVN